MNRRRWAGVAVAASVGVAATAAHAVFTASTTTPQTLQSVPDFLPPVSSRAQIVSTGGGVGAVYPGQQYRVYAQVDDQGNPPSGTSTVTADVSAISGSGARAVPLNPGSFTAGGASYNFGSGTQTASLVLTGSKQYSLTMADKLAQSATQSGFTVAVQQPCAPSAISAVNGSGRSGMPDSGDVVTYTFTVPVATTSILAGWTSGSAAVRVYLDNNSGSDLLTIQSDDGRTTTPLGAVNTRGNYVSGGDASLNGTISRSGNQIRVVLGSRRSGSPTTDYSRNQMSWTPASGLTDDYGQACSTSTLNQPSAAVNF